MCGGCVLLVKLVMLLMSCRCHSLAIITSNNPHSALAGSGGVKSSGGGSGGANLPPVVEWDLYDKEVGTWCAPEVDLTSPAEVTVTSPTSASESWQPSSTSTSSSAAETSPPSSSSTNSGASTSSASTSAASTSATWTTSLTGWLEVALRLVRSQSAAAACEDSGGGGDSGCKLHLRNATLPIASEMNLYFAAPSAAGVKTSAVLPDGSLTKSGARDAWIVLDPAPHTPFGHTVYAFAIDLNTAHSSCVSAGGVPLGRLI